MKAMEGSFVKLKIAEKEERMKVEREKKSSLKSVQAHSNGGGGIQKDGKYYLVRLEMELEKLKSLINEAESDQRLSQTPEEGNSSFYNIGSQLRGIRTRGFSRNPYFTPE